MTQPFPAGELRGLTPPGAPATPIGVGIDTSRYGHHASFLRGDLQPAAADLDFAESAVGARAAAIWSAATCTWPP
jgi:hypothetical protein